MLSRSGLKSCRELPGENPHPLSSMSPVYWGTVPPVQYRRQTFRRAFLQSAASTVGSLARTQCSAVCCPATRATVTVRSGPDPPRHTITRMGGVRSVHLNAVCEQENNKAGLDPKKLITVNLSVAKITDSLYNFGPGHPRDAGLRGYFLTLMTGGSMRPSRRGELFSPFRDEVRSADRFHCAERWRHE